MKETELQNTSETSKTEVQTLSAQDKARKHRKTAKAAISFIVLYACPLTSVCECVSASNLFFFFFANVTNSANIFLYI